MNSHRLIDCSTCQGGLFRGLFLWVDLTNGNTSEQKH